MKITNPSRNSLGTASFDGLCVGMRKPQEFIVYPMEKSGESITIQSDHRYGRIDLATGAGILSANKKQYASGIWLSLCIWRKTAVPIQLTPADLVVLRNAIKATGGLLVGDSFVKCDNTGALALQ